MAVPSLNSLQDAPVGGRANVPARGSARDAVRPYLLFTDLSNARRLLVVTDEVSVESLDWSLFPATTVVSAGGSLGQAAAPAHVHRVADLRRVPFDDGAFDLVVVSVSPRTLHHMLDEARRVLTPEGTLVVISKPWHIDAWQAPPLGRLLRTIRMVAGQWRLLRTLGRERHPVSELWVQPSVSRPRRLVHTTRGVARAGWWRPSVFKRLPHRVFLCGGDPTKSVLAEVGRAAQGLAERDPDLHVHDVLVSPTGTVAIRLDGATTALYAKVALSESAARRTQRHHQTLLTLETLGFTRSPRPLGAYVNRRCPFWFERALSGDNGAQDLALLAPSEVLARVVAVCEVLHELHGTTGRAIELDEAGLSDRLGPRFAALRACLQDPSSLRRVDRLEATLRSRLAGVRVHTALCHGDAKLANALLGADGRVTGLIDWDMSRTSDLSVLDILQVVTTTARQRHRLTLGDVVLAPLSPEHRVVLDDYWTRVKADPLDERLALLLLWLDRIYLQVHEADVLPDTWIQRNVERVIAAEVF